MSDTTTKVQAALNESRMLVLGIQVLVGAQFFAAYESSFGKLPPLSQNLTLVALAPLLLAMLLLMAPAPYQQLVDRGRQSDDFQRFITRIIELALLPFALGMGLDLYVVTAKLAGVAPGAAAGIALTLVAFFFWYGLEALARATGRREQANRADQAGQAAQRARAQTPLGAGREAPDGPPGGTKVEDRVRDVLTEARVVLPGVQALLGFQFDTVLTEAFDKLPRSSQYVHVGSLVLMTLAMILLMTPAAYHRLVERGEDTEHFRRFASRMVLASMVPLPLGIGGDTFVVVRKVTESVALAGIATVVLLLVFFGVWFGFMLFLRARRQAAANT